ncbi:hypothetical protein ABZ793_22390 [Micromonospora sp. NPDC047465]|uniref:hypothetical protein n=1 Tax=Micromonospora sp. NPDC047465 TaxID=3154813 RepID=UPI0033E9266D
MPSLARVPPRLAFRPFLGSAAVADGLLTWTMLRGRSWRRLLPDVHVHRDGYRADDHRMWCDAVALALPTGGVIAGRSAAYLWGVDLLDRDTPVAVLLPRAARMRAHPRLRVTRSVVPESDRTRFGGVARHHCPAQRLRFGPPGPPGRRPWSPSTRCCTAGW